MKDPIQSESITPESDDEISIWDDFVSKLRFWSKGKDVDPETHQEEPVEKKTAVPWFTLGALVLALIGQLSLEPSPARTPWPGVVLYAGALVCLLGAILKNEWVLPAIKPSAASPMRIPLRLNYLVIGILLFLFAFVLFGYGQFGILNTSLWVFSLVLIILAFWDKPDQNRINFRTFWTKLKQEGWEFRITHWTIIVLAVIAVILFFNFHRLGSVPPEMVSDHAEKLMDINDILNGRFSTYFIRNTGRETLHFYLTAAYMSIFNLGVSFFNLKVVAVFANLLTLFFIYLLGKEMGNKWVGLGAALLAGIAYWPLIFTRLALRIPYYPLFVGPLMYFMVRGLRRQNIADILWAGVFLGLGLHGYTPYRIVPIFVIFGILIYILHQKDRGFHFIGGFSLLLIGLVSLVVFTPLLRFWLANPELFAYRAFSRLTSMEAGFQASPILIFFENFWKSSLMFFWDNGRIWVHSVPGRPALEIVSGALYFMGIVGLIVRYARERQWSDLFLLVSIPMMMMPSILSLAFPAENPSLNRSAGAVVPVFVVAGLGLETTFRSIWASLQGRIGRSVVLAGVGFLVLWSGVNNYDLVFNQYYQIYRASTWNASEMGRVAAWFIESIGSPQTTFAVSYPHWVDSRNVAINAGFTGMDFVIYSERIPDTENDPRAKLFFVSVNDFDNQQLLTGLYPEGVMWQYNSAVNNKDFLIFFVPPRSEVTP